MISYSPPWYLLRVLWGLETKVGLWVEVIPGLGAEFAYAPFQKAAIFSSMEAVLLAPMGRYVNSLIIMTEPYVVATEKVKDSH